MSSEHVHVKRTRRELSVLNAQSRSLSKFGDGFGDVAQVSFARNFANENHRSLTQPCTARILGRLWIKRSKPLSVASAFASEMSVKTFTEAGTPISKTKLLHKPRASTRPQTNVSHSASYDDNAACSVCPDLASTRPSASYRHKRVFQHRQLNHCVQRSAQRRWCDNMSRESDDSMLHVCSPVKHGTNHCTIHATLTPIA